LELAVKQTFGSIKPNEVIAAVYRSNSPAAKLARLAPTLAKEAAAGEAYAVRILSDAMANLCCEVVKHVSRYLPGDGTVRFGLAGGFWRSSSMVQRVFDSVLGETLNRDYVLERIGRPPVWGAAALAMELSLVN
jgi:N-acetylglucosamine kinase-like BadF-type ATPase